MNKKEKTSVNAENQSESKNLLQKFATDYLRVDESWQVCVKQRERDGGGGAESRIPSVHFVKQVKASKKKKEYISFH